MRQSRRNATPLPDFCACPGPSAFTTYGFMLIGAVQQTLRRARCVGAIGLELAILPGAAAAAAVLDPAPPPLRFSAGVLGGFSTRAGDRRIREVAANASWRLGGAHDLGRRWSIAARLELSTGAIEGGADDIFVGALGPVVELVRQGFPLRLHAGIRPTYLNDPQVGWKDMGSNFQFSSHLGIEWQFHRRWHVGYRFQHMSNAGLGDTNPGMNLNLFDVGFHF
jgi:hypothetical protein